MRAFPQAVGAFVRSSIGKKFLVAATGVVWLLFLAGHLAGNLLIYFDPKEINLYAHELRQLLHGAALWVVRTALIVCAVVHIYLTIRLDRENRQARGVSYAREGTVHASLASRTMLFTGLLVLAYGIFHLMHFTWHQVDPQVRDWHVVVDGKEVHDVYSMVVHGFRNPYISGVYVVAMGLLSLHLLHGFASVCQTLGLRRYSRAAGLVEWVGYAYTAIIFFGNISIPIAIFARLGPFKNL